MNAIKTKNENINTNSFIDLKKSEEFKKSENFKLFPKSIDIYKIIIVFLIILLLILLSLIFLIIKIKKKEINEIIYKYESDFLLNYSKSNNSIKNIYLNYEFHNFERDKITKKMKKYSKWQLIKNEPYFINGIIRKFKPKKCLEIGVAFGGSAVLILNALKDINDSFLVSLDLNTNLYCNQDKKTGYVVEEYFKELVSDNKWHLFTGEQPHKFLEKLNLKYDFLFLDTVHLAPGELINIIEVLPFLEENAIIVMHDIMYHLPSNKYYSPKEIKYHPIQIYLMTALSGNKVFIKDEEKGVENIGAIFLNSNQKDYYLNYFLLLLSPWEYLPTDNQIEELRIFIKKYYKKDIYLNIFNRAIEENKIYINKFKTLYNNNLVS